MNDFTASNGVIVREHPGAIGVRRSVEDRDPVPVPGFTRPERVQTYFDPRQWDAVAEAVRAEEDARLGWWRYPADPDFVVLEPRDGQPVRVLRLSTGRSLDYFRSEPRVAHPSAFASTAYAYFDTHPEPKPWHDAKPGEVWLLDADTFSGLHFVAESLGFVGGIGFMSIPGGNRGPGLTARVIKTARRIYPEVTS
jgi:hypothetical protein